MIKAHQFEKTEVIVKNKTKAFLVSPSGVVQELDSIIISNIEFSYDKDGYETVASNGEHYALRFFPDECGIYTLTYGDETKKIDVTEGNNRGYIEVSKNDSRYFVTSDGRSYVPIGINLAFPTAYLTDNGFKYKGMKQYEYWFSECSKNGVSMARVWLGHEYFCPDKDEICEFDGIKLAKIDMLIDTARKYGIRLKLVIEQFRYFDYDRVATADSYDDDVFRKFNKKLYSKGHRCESAASWLSEKEWQDAWLEKINVLASRLSGDPTVFAIELWNEMDCMPRAHRIDWNRKMLPAVKKLFPRHLVVNSLGSLDSENAAQNYENFCWELTDTKELHRYLDNGAKLDICKSNIIDLIRDGINRVAEKDKPTLLSESGAVNDCHSGPFSYYTNDKQGIIFCDCVYTPLFCGAADCGNIWHWDARYVDNHKHWRLFKPIYELCREIEFDKEDFCSEIIEDQDTILLLLRGKSVTIGYLRNKNANWQTLLCKKEVVLPITDKTIRLEEKAAFSFLNIDGYLDSISYKNDTLYIKHLEFGALLRWDK